MALDRIQPLAPKPIGVETSKPAAESTPAGAFVDELKRALDTANQDLKSAETEATKVAAGTGDIVDTMVALSNAELSLRHVTSIRNRVLEAYQEVLRLQL